MTILKTEFIFSFFFSFFFVYTIIVLDQNYSSQLDVHCIISDFILYVIIRHSGRNRVCEYQVMFYTSVHLPMSTTFYRSKYNYSAR